jgi:cytochrome c biogenesis protein CcmG/thiol:disulfide interchange protein DsbE
VLATSLKLETKEIPSPLIDKQAPYFNLPILSDTQQRLSRDELKGRVWILNVWASWCTACATEIPVLMELSQRTSNVLLGLNYKDEQEDANQWLLQNGTPYADSIMDVDGVTGIDYGVYGVPETFIVDKKGNIRYKHSGPLEYPDLEKTILPLINTLDSE